MDRRASDTGHGDAARSPLEELSPTWHVARSVKLGTATEDDQVPR
jgi:hypothetical protein